MFLKNALKLKQVVLNIWPKGSLPFKQIRDKMEFVIICDDANIGGSCSILVKCFHGTGAEIHKAAIEWSIIWLVFASGTGFKPSWEHKGWGQPK